MFGMFVFFAFLAAVIITPQVLRSIDRRRMYETLRVAYERGQPIPPEMLATMTRSRSDPAPVLEEFDPAYAHRRDLRRGVIWASVGVGLCLIGAAFYAGLYDVGGAVETCFSFVALGAVPLCVGAAYIGLWWFGGRKTAA